MLAKIYKLEGGGKFYIGSTTLALNKRLNKHHSKAKEEISKKRPLYVHFRGINWENTEIILITEIEVKDRRELLQIEKEYISKYKTDKNCLNKTRPIITEEEKKISDAEHQKRRRIQFKERERERLQKWRKENSEKRKLQSQRSNAKQKEKSTE